MRRVVILLLAAPLALVAGGWTSAADRPVASAASCAKGDLTLVKSSELTVGTDNPAYPPWYAGGTPKGSQWKINDPSNGKGFEPVHAGPVTHGLAGIRHRVEAAGGRLSVESEPGKGTRVVAVLPALETRS